MDSSDIINFFEGKTIFITGSTGFLAKILVEKILRIQPNIAKLFLLIRQSDSKSVQDRLYQEIIGTELFKVVKDKYGERFKSLISDKVVCVSGEISCENLGIQDPQLLQTMYDSVDIIVNSAATTKFDERYDVAMGINVVGTLHLLSFAKKCVNFKVFLHVSTAYVCVETTGRIGEKTAAGRETVDVDLETKLANQKLKTVEGENASAKHVRSAMKEFGLQRAKQHGWPNTYVFTKAMGEMVLEEFKEGLNVIIIRPTIVSSTLKEPFPGWIQGVRTLDSLMVPYGKGTLKHFVGDPDSIVDIIPADMVVNCMLVSIVAHAYKLQKHHIYHIGSSSRNHLKFADIDNLAHSYFTQNPWMNQDGNLVKVNAPRIFTSFDAFSKYIDFWYSPLLKFLEIVNILSCHRLDFAYTKMKREINSVMYMAELYHPFLFFHGIFDDSNTEHLGKMITEDGSGTFEFNPAKIQWTDYFLSTNFPATVKYLF